MSWMIIAHLSFIEYAIVIVAITIFSVVSFCVGMISERWSAAAALKKAAKDFQKSIDQTLEKLDRANKACLHLESFSGEVISQDIQNSLEEHRGGLMASLSRLIKKSKEALQSARSSTASEKRKQNKDLVWVKEPVDARSQLPDQIALDENLTRLVDTVGEDQSASILLVQIDRFDSLAQRYGDEEKDHLLQSMAKLLVRLSREDDLVCHSCDGLFAVLIPKVNFSTGIELADATRDSIRAHRFRLTDVSREVLMTASFGFYQIIEGDKSDLAFHRAFDALGEAKRKGRNQLHYHDGQKITSYAGKKRSMSG